MSATSASSQGTFRPLAPTKPRLHTTENFASPLGSGIILSRNTSLRPLFESRNFQARSTIGPGSQPFAFRHDLDSLHCKRREAVATAYTNTSSILLPHLRHLDNQGSWRRAQDPWMVYCLLKCPLLSIAFGKGNPAWRFVYARAIHGSLPYGLYHTPDKRSPKGNDEIVFYDGASNPMMVLARTRHLPWTWQSSLWEGTMNLSFSLIGLTYHLSSSCLVTVFMSE